MISHKIESQSFNGAWNGPDCYAISPYPSTFSSESLRSQPFNRPFVLALGGVALLFAGAGAISVDERVFGRSRWPARISLGLLVIAIAVALLTWIVLNGNNPIHFEAPAN